MRSESNFNYLTHLCSEEPTRSSERFLSTLAFGPVWLSFYKPDFYQLSKAISIQLLSFVKKISIDFVIKMWWYRWNLLDGF